MKQSPIEASEALAIRSVSCTRSVKYTMCACEARVCVACVFSVWLVRQLSLDSTGELLALKTLLQTGQKVFLH